MIFGHKKNELALIKALETDRIFPTWIFSGPFGVGKSTVAHQFAKCLLSGYVPENGELSVPDPIINREVDNRVHPDFNILEQTDDSVSIDDIRALFSKIHMAPVKAKRKVIILENGSSFNKNVSNSLLKILEEPPKNTVIILICTTIGNLPKTLLSRAMKLYFSPLDVDIVEKYLNNKGIDNAHELAELSRSIGLALKLHENSGLQVYNALLHGFEKQEVYKALKFIKDNNISFDIVKTCLIHILYEYAKSYDDSTFDSDQKIACILKIISQIDHCETYMLDKNAVIASTYEQFFSMIEG